MINEHPLYLLLQSYLNPALFLLYLSFQNLFNTFGIETFTSCGVNNQRLVISRYLLLMPVIYLIWFVINFFFLSSFSDNLTIHSFAAMDMHWLQYLSLLITAVTLISYTSKTGMEGNILGFIFAPMLFAAIVINGIFYLMWVWEVVLKGGAA